MEEINEESYLTGYPNIIPYECSKKIIEQMEKNICKFKIEKKKETIIEQKKETKIEQVQGTGFFCKIPFPNRENMLPVFITNHHLINEDILNKDDGKIQIKIKKDNDEKIISIKDRLKYTNEKYDTTIIEIKEKDGIKDFLELDEGIINHIINNKNENNEYKDETIYIIQYPEFHLSVSYGILAEIFELNPYKFNHKCDTRKGSSGAPILNLNNKIIGIHIGGYKEKIKQNFNAESF